MNMKLFKLALIMIVLLFSIQIPSAKAATLEGETTVNLNVRATPSTSGKLIQTLKKGTKVKYGTYSKEWSKIYLNNRTYYASAQYIKRISTPAKTVAKQAATSTGVTTVNLNIRVSAHSQATVYRTLKKGRPFNMRSTTHLGPKYSSTAKRIMRPRRISPRKLSPRHRP